MKKIFNLKASIHTLSIRFQGLTQKVEKSFENCIYTSYNNNKDLTTCRINVNKLGGDILKFSEFKNVLAAILEQTGNMEYQINRFDIRFDSYDKTHYKRFWKLYRMLISLIGTTYSTQKNYCIRNCMSYAEENGYLQENVFAKVKVNAKMFRKVQKKPDYTQVYLAHEQPLIIDEAWKDYNKNPENTTPLAVILMFYLAVRPGEIVALQESDFCSGILSIQRMESGEFEEIEPGKYTRVSRGVAEHTKTDAGDRNIPLIKKAIDIITLVMKINAAHGNSGGYLFLNNGERIKESGVSWRLEKYCNHLNIPYRSPHKIRKTAISSMIDGGMNINTIRKFVGHEDERTTYNNYCYDRRTSEQVLNQLENALDNNTAVNILPFVSIDKKQVITGNQVQVG